MKLMTMTTNDVLSLIGDGGGGGGGIYHYCYLCQQQWQGKKFLALPLYFYLLFIVLTNTQMATKSSLHQFVPTPGSSPN
jgi:hypothetical protein